MRVWLMHVRPSKPVVDCQLHKENKEARDGRTQTVNKPELERDNEKEYAYVTNADARTKSLKL